MLKNSMILFLSFLYDAEHIQNGLRLVRNCLLNSTKQCEVAVRSAVVALQCDRGSGSRSGARQCERGLARRTCFNTQEKNARRARGPRGPVGLGDARLHFDRCRYRLHFDRRAIRAFGQPRRCRRIPALGAAVALRL